jgi:hypothetical protein
LRAARTNPRPPATGSSRKVSLGKAQSDFAM